MTENIAINSILHANHLGTNKQVQIAEPSRKEEDIIKVVNAEMLR